jgi:very-short-patch-repair endonuclease
MSKSGLEDDLWLRMVANDLDVGWERDQPFVLYRDWRFDFVHHGYRIAVEVEGGTYSGGRHTTGTGYQGDCEKYNEATLNGYLLLRFTSKDIHNGKAVDTIERAVVRRGAWHDIENVIRARVKRSQMNGGYVVQPVPPPKKRRPRAPRAKGGPSEALRDRGVSDAGLGKSDLPRQLRARH